MLTHKTIVNYKSIRKTVVLTRSAKSPCGDKAANKKIVIPKNKLLKIINRSFSSSSKILNKGSNTKDTLIKVLNKAINEGVISISDLKPKTKIKNKNSDLKLKKKSLIKNKTINLSSKNVSGLEKGIPNPKTAKSSDTKFAVNATGLINKVPTVFISIMNALSLKLDISNVEEAIKQVVTYHDRLIINHGVVDGTKRFSELRLYAIRLLEGQNPDPLSFVATGKKDKWPSKFNLLRPYFYLVRDDMCQTSDQILRSILYINRLCKGNNNADISDIVKEFEVSSKEILRFKTFLSDSKINKGCPVGELISKPTTRVLKNGPNGKPKWQTAEAEAYTLINSEYNTYFKDLCNSTGNKDLYIYMSEISKGFTRKDRSRLRYITTIADSGNKCRLVAISDYWTQVILEPIMVDVQRFINYRYKNVSSNLNHAQGFNKLKTWIKPGIASYDIKSWTDAFPHSLQYEFMLSRYGKQIADAWYGLVVNCSWELKGSKDSVKYGRGQGMGTAGSFDIATATDLILLEMLYKQEYSMNLHERIINKVGDDLWCYDPDSKIRNYYTQDLGMEISVPKTKFATNENLCGEFVSRNLNNGKDVSRISANICRAVGKNILDLPQLAEHLEERGYNALIPIGDIFLINKIKGDHLLNVFTTLVLLCLMYKQRTGTKLLMDSLNEYVSKNNVDLSLNLKLNHILMYFVKGKDSEPEKVMNALRNTFIIFSCFELLSEIEEKVNIVFDAATEFDSSEEALKLSDPALYWVVNKGDTPKSIELLTSEYIYSKSFKSASRLFQSDWVNPDIDISLSELETINQSLTFRELGVITSAAKPWRPTTTRLFNFVKNLNLSPKSELVHYNSEIENAQMSIDIMVKYGSSTCNLEFNYHTEKFVDNDSFTQELKLFKVNLQFLVVNILPKESKPSNHSQHK